LFSDLLLYAKIVPGTGTMFSAERYLLSEKTSLHHVHFEDRPDDLTVEPKVLFSFVIRIGKKAFAVFASSDEEKSEWMLMLSNALSTVLPEQVPEQVTVKEAPEAPNGKTTQTLCRWETKPTKRLFV
jgi:hypothetical protein